MTNFFHYRNFSSNHLARSIIITPTPTLRPSWMNNNERFSRNRFPTPAMCLYRAVVSVPFIRWYFTQEPDRRDILLKAVSRELYHEGGGRIYKRFSRDGSILEKLNLKQFKAIIAKRLDNFRYDTKRESCRFDYNLIQSSFTEGERVMVASRSGIMYEGTFQFDSVINSDYCYIQFDSRIHIMRWEKSLVEKIDLIDTSNRRITRQMARTMRLEISNTTSNHNSSPTRTRNRSNSQNSRRRRVPTRNGRFVILSDVSEDSSDTESDNENDNHSRRVVPHSGNDRMVDSRSNNSSNISEDIVGHTSNPTQNQGVSEVARARTSGLFHSSSDSDDGSDNVVETEQNNDGNSTGGESYEFLLELFGDGTENRTCVDEKWLSLQGFISNPLKDVTCYVCYEEIVDNELVYNIKCNGVFRHPLHCLCAQRYIEMKHTCCGICKFLWEP